ncbi:MAG: hypothetical protein HOF35_01875 [Bacteroidetes bacterium]|nr:hypothetical protein [Bacteroidota bacterium]MBT7827329.1 hypothetical protein [Bacteroidota bacterium]
MRISYRFIVFFVIFSLSFSAFSQVYKFSKDPEEFQDEIKRFYKGIKVEKTNLIVDEFVNYVKLEELNPEEFLRIVETCNLMLKKHFKPLPYFETYLELVNAYKKNNIDIGKFREWNSVYSQHLEKSKRNIKEFNTTMMALFTKNAIYDAKSKTWYLGTTNYNIVYEKQPKIIVNEPITLICTTREDSLVIYNTMGTYLPLLYKWSGTKGIVDWQRVELDSTRVHCKFDAYKIDVRKAELEVDSVTFWNKNYFSKQLVGRLTEKANTTHLGKKAKYPKFRSYRAVYILDKLSKNVLYIGGFTQEGLNMMGSSSMEVEGEPVVKARVLITYKGQPTLKAESDAFMITPDKIVASNARTTIYYGEDSIYHPKIIFNYSIKTRKLILTRGDNGMYRSPMYDTYHKLEMEFDQLDWTIDNPKMDFRMFYGSEGSAMFTSESFFTMAQYNKTKSVLTFHPLNKIKELCLRLDTNVFSKYDFANYMGVRPENVEALLITLTMDGYIIFDNINDIVTVRDKTFLYVNAEANKMDYDMLRFESTIKKSNAVFSLESGNLDLEGIRLVLLSDTHRVHIVPRQQKVTMKDSRNFEFDGYIRGGLFEFFGNDFYFDYENFKFNLTNIDSVRMYVRIDENQPNLIAQIQSVLQDVSGYLYVDNPKNKSGRKNYPEYPIFECTKNSYVYYDKKEILGGHYSRDRFYFDIKPFIIDSLDKFKMKGLEFEGTFYSGDILPVFDYKLVPQEDLSLGFSKTDHFPLYVAEGAPKGEGDQRINLSNKGLRGNGKIEYLTSITQSEDFIYFFDSVRSHSNTFDLEHNAMGKYPKVVGREVFTRWLAYADTMIIEKKQIPFKIYEKGYEFSGNMVLTPARLTSKGVFDYKNSTISSQLFEFTPHNLLSEKATVRIFSDDPNLYAFIAPASKINLDVDTDILDGESTKSDRKLLFPLNRYTTSMKHFIWYNLEDRIAISKADMQSEQACYFRSTKKDQDSLQFQSTFANYDLKKYYINAEKIPYIPVADARIYPDQGLATIERDAFMQSLKNAVVKADTINYHHVLYDALINVFGKYKYTGYGKYDYIDKYKSKQVLSFYQIRVDEERRTYARSKVPDSMDFRLSPQFKFGGYAELNGNVKELDFDGFVLPAHKQDYFRTGWFSYHDRINPDSVYFSLNKPVGREGRELYTGLYVGTDSPYVYNLWTGYKKAFADAEIFSVDEGVMYYDDKTNKYIYAALEKVFDHELYGSYFALSDKTGDTYGEGKFDFGEDIKAIEIQTAGTVNFFMENGNYIFDLMMTIDFPFDEKAINIMADEMMEHTYFRKSSKNRREATKIAISELITDEKERDNLLIEIEDFDEIIPTKSLTKTIVLSDLKLTYDLKERLFKTSSDKFSIISIQKVKVNKEIIGGLQLSKKKSGTMFALYLESEENYYNFFKYYYGIYSVLGSNEDFNKQVSSTISKHSENKYRIKKATNRDLNLFKKKMNLY